MNRSVCRLVAVVIALSLAGVAGVAAQAPKRGGTLVLVRQGEATNLDPHKVPAFTSHRVFELIYSTLTSLGPDGAVHPSLAESWTVAPDGRQVTFRLRAAKFHNGDAVTSADVNDYIRDASDADFTAKHFRTWGASVIAFDQLLKKEEDKRISVATLIEPVAEALGNTPAMARKSYVHPALIEATKDNPRDPLGGMERPRERKWLSSAEVGFLQFLAKGERRRRKTASA